MKLFVATLFCLLVLILSVTTWRTSNVQFALARLETDAREILDHPDNLGLFSGLTVERKQFDLVLSGTADREIRDRAIKLLNFGQGKRIPGLRGGVVVDAITVGNPEPPVLKVESQDLLLSFEGRIPEGAFRGQLEAVAREFPVNPIMGMLKTSRDVGGADWFGAMPAFVRKFLTGAEGATLILTDESLILDRTVADDAAREELLKAAQATVPATILVDGLKLRIAPGLHLVREGDGWIISGAVPDEQTVTFVRQMVEQADPASVGKNVLEKLAIRPGMPPAIWLRRFPTFFQQFAAGVRSGAEITVTGNEVILDGDVNDNAVAARLRTTADSTFGPPMIITSRMINANNPLRRLAFDFGKTSSTEVIVVGNVPTAQVAEQLTAGLKQAFPSRRINELELKVDPLSQTEDWVASLPRFLLEFSRRAGGNGFLKLDVRKASLSGSVPNEITKDALGLYLKWALGSTFTVENLLTVDSKAKPPAPYDVSRVTFAEAKALIDPKQLPVLTGVAARLQQPGERVVLIKAFASKSGSEPANLAISAKRADAVRGELAKNGVADDRVLVQPTGKNGAGGSPQGAERRVELIILEE